MDEYRNFLCKLQRWGSNPHKLGHCYGTRDAWKWVRKNKWKALDGKPFDQLLYSKIINDVNQAILEQLFEGHKVDLPYQMGSLILSSKPTSVFIQDGKVITNYRTDWKKTLLYWFNDSEAREKRQFIKKIQKELYYIKYQKEGTKYRNRKFYFFRANRSLVRRLGEAEKSGRLLSEKITYNL